MKFSEEQKTTFKARISGIATFAEPTTRLEIVKDDLFDNRILECAVAAKADFIISGDADLLAIREYKGTRIMTASDYLK